jgi:hypothetical protein
MIDLGAATIGYSSGRLQGVERWPACGEDLAMEVALAGHVG